MQLTKLSANPYISHIRTRRQAGRDCTPPCNDKVHHQRLQLALLPLYAVAMHAAQEACTRQGGMSWSLAADHPDSLLACCTPQQAHLLCYAIAFLH